ncbi:hypothetical protein BD770DRAFT_432766 [Pilaira anomala]|nr:hypothetical protein BD770DRAFT_432766 [Pilaira anomala]
MTNKTNVSTSPKKGKKKTQSPKVEKKTKVVHTTSTSAPPKKREQEKPKKEPNSVKLSNDDKKVKKIHSKKRGKSVLRQLISISIASYLAYAFYECGSPFDKNTTGKPAVCSAIDPIKADLYSLYQSDFYHKNAEPYITPVLKKGNELYVEYGIPAQGKLTELYLEHGIPAQKKVSSLYTQHAQPRIQQGCNHMQVVYKKQLEPYLVKAVPYVNPYLNLAKPYVIKLKSIQQKDIDVLCEKTKEKVTELQGLMEQNMEKLPPSVLQAKDNLMDWIQKAETTELLPAIQKIYWIIIDFIQFDLIPRLEENPIVIGTQRAYHDHVKTYFNANVKPLVDTNIKPIVDNNLKPFIRSVVMPFVDTNITPALIHFQFDKLLDLIKFHLTQRPIVKEEKVFAAKTTSTQIKTSSSIKSKTKDIPITSVVDKTVTISKRKEATVSTTTALAVTSTTTSTTTISTATAKTTTFAKPKATVGKYASNDDDIMKEKSIKPAVTEVYEEVSPPDPERKEAIYVPVCNPEEEQLIVANTDKNIQTVRTDKHIVAVPTDKDLFEVHKEKKLDIPAQPTTPSTKKEELEEPKDQFVIQAPIPHADKSVKEDIVIEEESEVPTPSEEAVFSIQTELPTNIEEDIISSIHAEEEAAVEEEILSKIQAKESPILLDEDVVFSTQVEKPTNVVAEKLLPTVVDEEEEVIDKKENSSMPVVAEEEEEVIDKEENSSMPVVAEEEAEAEKDVPVIAEEEEKAEKDVPVITDEKVASTADVPTSVVDKKAAPTDNKAIKESEKKTSQANTQTKDEPEIPCEIAPSSEKESTIVCEIADQGVKKEDKIFIPPAIEKEELVLDSSNKDGAAAEEPVFIKVKEPVQDEKVQYQEPIVKVDQMDEHTVDIKVPTIKE